MFFTRIFYTSAGVMLVFDHVKFFCSGLRFVVALTFLFSLYR